MNAKNKENAKRRDLVGHDVQIGDQVWLREFEKLDRGTLRKLEGRWNGLMNWAEECHRVVGR